MKKWIVAALVIVLALLFVMALPSRQSATVPPPSDIPALAPAAPSPTTFTVSSTSFEEVLSAHGGRKEIAAISALTVAAARLSVISLTDFFERQVVVSLDGTRFKRRVADLLGLRTEIECLDERGVFRAAVITRAATGEAVSAAAPNDDARRRDVKLMVDTSSLLLILRRCTDASVRVVAAERAAQGLDKFTLATVDGTLIVYADRLHLVRRVEMGDKVFQYAEYRTVDGLQLPYVQRLSIGSRLFYEWFISNIDLHPTFAPGFFNQAE
jgi:hypothetical protein